MTRPFTATISLLSRLYGLIGFAGSATLIVTSFIIHYNELHNPEYPSQDVDWPAILTFVDLGLAIAALLMGIVVFQATGSLKKISRCQLWIAIIFLGVCIAGHTGIAIIRAFMMGLFGAAEGNCADTGILTGCPTTRWESSTTENIEFDTPYLPECSFWYWDNMYTYAAMVKQVSLVNDTQVKAQISSAAQEVRMFMDWSERSSYGWRMDDTDASRMLDTSGISPDTTNNMDRLMEIQEQYKGVSNNAYVSISDPLSTKPSLSHCWYWGCHPICIDERHAVNMWWLMTSTTLAVVNAVILVIVICLRNEKDGKNKDEENDDIEAQPDEEEESNETPDPDAPLEFIPAPYMKRRQRFANAKIKLVF